MPRLVAALVAVLLFAVPLPARAAAGDLDPGFGGDGLAWATFTDGAQGFSSALAPDGSLVVAGQSGTRLALARFLPDGSLDPTFSGDGKVTLSVGEGSSQANDVAVQPDGRVVVAAYGVAGGRPAIHIVRLDPDGSRDRGFGVGGVAVTSFPGPAIPRGLALQDDGAIVVTGEAGPEIVLLRYTPEGLLDPTFSGDGWLTLSAGVAAEDAGADVAVTADARIVLAASVDGNTGFLAARFDAAGNPDPTFRAAGYAIVRVGGDDTATSVVAGQSGKVFVGGFTTPTGGVCCEMVLIGLGSRGGRLTGFGGGDGVAESVPAPGGWGLALSLLQTRDGLLVAAGTGGATGEEQDLVVSRFGPDGSPDDTFGGGDGVTMVVKRGQESGQGIALTSTGELVVGGSRFVSSSYRFMAARFLAA